MDKKIIKQFSEKIEKDYTELVSILLEDDKEDILNKSYDNAIMFNFYDALTDYIDTYNELNDERNNEELFILKDKTVNAIINYKDNIFLFLLNGYLNLAHPERYNIWFSYYDGLVEVIESITNKEN